MVAVKGKEEEDARRVRVLKDEVVYTSVRSRIPYSSLLASVIL